MNAKKLEFFHKIIAVAMTLIMFVVLIPTSKSEALGKDTIVLTSYYPTSGSYTYTQEGSDLAKNYKAAPSTIPSTTPRSTNPNAIFVGYSCKNRSAKLKGDFTSSGSTVRSIRETEIRHVVETGGKNVITRYTDTHQFYALPIRVTFRDGEDNSYITQQTLNPSSVYGVGSTSGSVTYQVSMSDLLKTNKIPDRYQYPNNDSHYFQQSELTGGTAKMEYPFVVDRESPFTNKINNVKNVAVRVDASTVDLDFKVYYKDIGEYKVTYNAGYGTGTSFSGTPVRGDGVTQYTIEENNDHFTRTHYAFTGWNTNKAGTGKVYSPGDKMTLFNDVSLYAQWKQLHFQVKYDANGANSKYANIPEDNTWYDPDVVSSATVLDGDTAGRPLKKNGKVFSGWNTQSDGKGIHYDAGDTVPITSSLTEDITLYAEWKEADEHFLDYKAGGETGSTVSRSFYDDGIPENLLVAAEDNDGKFTSSHYTFLTWKRALDGKRYAPAETFDFDMSQPRETLDAVWGAVVTYDDNQKTTGDVPVDNKIYELNSSASAKDNSGGLKKNRHRFTGWDLTDNKEPQAAPDYQAGDQVPLSQNTTLYAHWEPAKEFKVEYDPNLPSDRSLSDLVGNIPQDTKPYYNDGLNEAVEIEPTTMKLPVYHFLYWMDDSGKKVYPGDSYKITGTSSPVTFYAKWEKARDYTLSYNANAPAGADALSGSLPPSQVRSSDGLKDTFTVSDDSDFSIPGQSFRYWSTTPDDRAGSDRYTGTENIHVSKYGKNVTLYAQWDTELTITKADSPDKTYDGTADWRGRLTVNGVRPGEKITLENNGGTYRKADGSTDKDVGAGKDLVIENLTITGKGNIPDHYYLKDGQHGSLGSYDPNDDTFTMFGEIKKRDITIIPKGNPDYIIKGDDVPAYELTLKTGSALGAGDSLSSTFGTPQYTCELTKPDGTKIPLAKNSEESNDYVLSVSGLSNDNYSITTETSKISVQYPGSTQVKVTYDANLPNQEFSDGWAVGSVPVDTNKYYTYSDPQYKNSVVKVMENNNLVRFGYDFLGWDTDRNCKNNPKFPKGGTNNQFTITGDTTLYAVWEGNTDLTITGLTTKKKVYDGTADYQGKITFTGAVPSKDVTIEYRSAAYDSRNAGTNKIITLKGITLSGSGKDMYRLKDGGMYDQKKDTLTIRSGSITPRPITIAAKTDPKKISEGDPLPNYAIETTDGTSLGAGDAISDLGTPVITCVGTDEKAYTTASEAGRYTLKVSGLTNPNYTYTYEDTYIEVVGADGKTPAVIRFDGNGADGGTIPGDIYCFTYDEPSKNDTVIIPQDEPALKGCAFLGWSENPNAALGGSDTIYRYGGAADQFRVSGSTTLYAVWEADTDLHVTGITKDSKVYENSDLWDGDLILSGVLPGDEVKAVYEHGKYSSKDAGERDITADSIRLTGKDAFRYVLKDGGSGIYDEAAKTLKAAGEILQRPIELMAYVTSDNPALAGGDEPDYDFRVSGGTLADGETVNVFKQDLSGVTYTIEDAGGSPVLWSSIAEAAGYILKVTGVKNPNYAITYKDGFLGTKDRDKSVVRIFYHDNPAEGITGTPPTDVKDYFLYIDTGKAKDTADIQKADGLSRHGYAFREWNTKADGTGKAYQPGPDQLVVTQEIVDRGQIHLWPIFKGNTPLTVKALTDIEKVYDGTSKWKGDLILDGLEEGDEVTASYAKGYYTDHEAGKNKTVTVEGITFSGKDMDKYILKESEIFDPVLEEAVETDGKIRPRKLQIIPTATPDVLNVGDPLPAYGVYLPAQSKIINPDELKDFGEPQFTCKNLISGKPLSQTSEVGDYILSVSGFSHRNYEIEADTSRVKVTAPGLKEVHVTYRANGGRGAVPVDKNTYYTCNDPSRNSIVTVLGSTLTRSGYKFLGWSESVSGKGMKYQAGDTFRIMKDTVLNAVWEKLPEEEPKDPEKDKTKPDSKEDDPKDQKDIDNTFSDKTQNETSREDTDNANTARLRTAEETNRSGKKEKHYFTTKSVKYGSSLTDEGLVRIEDEKVPKAASPYGAEGTGGRNGLPGVFGSFADCHIHWLILIGMLITALYDAFRMRKAKKKEPDEEQLFADKILPVLPLLAVVIFFFYRQCILDIWLLVTWIIGMEFGRYMIHRAYEKETEESIAE